MTKLVLIAFGGALGALLRYAVAGGVHGLLGEAFPYGTLAVNLVGCFLIGVLWAAAERTSLPWHVGPLVFTGTLGAFTTFSTYALESFNLMREGEVGRGLLNIAASNLLGLAGVALGFALGWALMEGAARG